MTFTRLPRTLLVLAALVLSATTAAAQRGKPQSDSPRPAASPRPAPAPKPVAPPPAPRPQPAAVPRSNPTPRPVAPPSFPKPTQPIQAPRSEPRSRPTPMPRPQTQPPQAQPPQWQPPRATPRPTAPIRQPGMGRQPGQVQPLPAPKQFPRDDGTIRVPGTNAPKPTYPSPSSPGGSAPTRGGVRVVERKDSDWRKSTPPPVDKPVLRPRDLYDDTLARPKAPRSPNAPEAPKPGQGRPTTTKQLVERYRAAPKPTGPDEPIAKPRPVASPRQNIAPKERVGAPRPVLVDRYATPVQVQPRGKTPPAGGAPVINPRPTLQPRSATAPRGVLVAPRSPTPRLVAPTRTTTSLLTGSRAWRGSCFGPVWDPCWSWSNRWSSHCSPSLVWCLGIGSGSFCWGWSSWFPWQCHRRHFAYTPIVSWWDPWCYQTSPAWWWPRSYYAPTYLYADPAPSSVVVVDNTPLDETPVVDSATRALSPADRAQRYLALGDFYFREGRFRDAADTYGKARAAAPDDASIHFVLADAEFALGDYHFAAFLIGEALRLDPTLARADTDKRLLYGDPKLFESQIETLVRYLDEKPYDAMAHLVLGYNLKLSGKPVDAAKAFRRVLEIDPGSEAAKLLLDATLNPTPAAPAEAAPAAPDAATPAEPGKTDR